ncbi:MAG: agmatinase [Ignavibacteria bacterium]|nr:agmatinase [Ignavibacteria bacterium]
MKQEKSLKVLPQKKNFLSIPKEYSSFNNSIIAILPCPYEKTTSYGKGTIKGPEAIIKASHYVEFFDEETAKEVCFTHGIVTLKPISFREQKAKEALGLIYNSVKALIEEGKFVITIGGEHTISTAPIRAHYEKYERLSILHFDAHSDLRNEYEGNKYSHACFAARVAEFTTKITQVGIRALCREEYDFIKDKKISTFFAHEIREHNFNEIVIDRIIETLDENVYITFDVDYFDPSLMPSTGTPEPNGFYWAETMRLLKKVCEKRNLVGFDVVELAPRKSFPFPDFLTAKLIYKIINYRF